jgi:hypothetical protein
MEQDHRQDSTSIVVCVDCCCGNLFVCDHCLEMVLHAKILKCVRMWNGLNGSVHGPVVESCEHDVHSFSILSNVLNSTQ